MKFASTAMLAALITTITAGSSNANEEGIIRLDAVVRAMNEVQIPAKRDGVLTNLTVRKGDQIVSQELIASIDTADADANLDVAIASHNAAIARSEDESQITAANVEYKVAIQEDKTIERIRNNTSALERARTKGELYTRKARLQSAINEKDLATIESEVTKAQLVVAQRDVSQRTVTSPITGSVLKVHNYAGEFVRRGDPIVTAIRMDKLSIEGFLDVSIIPPHRAAGTSVTFELQNSNLNFKGTIENASPKIDVDGKYQVWFSVENRKSPDMNGKQSWVLRPGMAGILELELPVIE